MATKKSYTWYYMAKHIKNTDGKILLVIPDGRVRVKGEKKRQEFEARGYEVIDKVEVK